MPNVNQYLNQARYNKSLAEELLKQNKPDWAITLAFYSALHCVNALLVSNNISCISLTHPIRDRELKNFTNGRTRGLYKELRVYSEVVRYISSQPDPTANPPSHTHSFVFKADEILHTKLPQFIQLLDHFAPRSQRIHL